MKVAEKVRSIYVYKSCKLLNKNPRDYLPKDQLNLIENVARWI